MTVPSPPAGPVLTPEQLQAPLARMLRPLVRLLIRSGITFPAQQDLMRELYVNVAENDFALPGKEQTDSRVSLLTGIHRKEVSRLRGAGAPVSAIPTAVSRSAKIIARWMGAEGYQDAEGKPLPLARSHPDPSTPSFESLVEAVTRDVRPRAVLDEWISQGIVVIDEAQRIVLSEAAFSPKDGGEALAYYVGRNLHDHIAATVSNVSGEGPKFLERAVHYDGLTEEQAADLEAFARNLAMQALTKANAKALSAVEGSGSGEAPQQGAPQEPAEKKTWRWNFGVYVYRENIEKASGSK
ncbi:MAG: DUF6502 family protein [Alphaproteobacteria bacterium]